MPALHDAAWFAEQIGMSEDWVRRNSKRLPCHKVGRMLRFSEDSVRIFLERTAIDPERLSQTERSRML
ncbi:hypothetical protein SAMN06309944_1118 [Micrococcales bacterium KH10]|nr:hypothetical protein SAMN06309944_1118 [Micrococcales bacterium KH10]